MTVRAVVFDLFDTLVDLPMEGLPRVVVGGQAFASTLGALHEAYAARHPIAIEPFAAALRDVDRGWRASWEQGRELPTTERFERLLEQLGGGADPELVERLTQTHMGLLAALARTPAHHAALLARLGERFALGLCSNFSHAPTARAILEEAGLDASLDAIVISHEHGLRKPRPEIFEATLDALGVAPDEAVHVGDNLDADVTGAAQAGLRTIWITRCVRDPDEVLAKHRGPAPTWRVADLAEIDALLT